MIAGSSARNVANASVSVSLWPEPASLASKSNLGRRFSSLFLRRYGIVMK